MNDTVVIQLVLNNIKDDGRVMRAILSIDNIKFTLGFTYSEISKLSSIYRDNNTVSYLLSIGNDRFSGIDSYLYRFKRYIHNRILNKVDKYINLNVLVQFIPYNRYLYKTYLSVFNRYIYKLNVKKYIFHANDIYTLMIAINLKDRIEKLYNQLNIKVIYDVHEDIYQINTNSLKKRISIYIEKKYIHSVDHILTVSDPLKDIVKNRYNLNSNLISVIHNTPILSTKGDSIRDVLNLKKYNLLLYSGYISPDRNIDIVLKAISILKYKKNIRFIIITNSVGKYLEYLKEIIHSLSLTNNVIFYNYVSVDKIIPLYKHVDVGLIPLRTDIKNNHISYITKFYEYLSANIPIILSDLKLMSDFVREYNIGEVYKPYDDYINLASSIDKILSNKNKYIDAYKNVDINEFNYTNDSDYLKKIYQTIN